LNLPESRNRTSRARWALGLFAIVWCNLALQPCAMAFGADSDADCTHCPPSETRGHSQHGEHAVSHSHDSSSNEAPCDLVAANCFVADEFSYEGRIGKANFKDAIKDATVFVFVDAHPVQRLAEGADSDRQEIQLPPPGASPPLNILYCVYLI